MSLALHANRHSFFQALSSHYREAYETAEEGVRTATEFDSLLDYSVGHFFGASALLFLGEWGQVRGLLRSAADVVKKNRPRDLGSSVRFSRRLPVYRDVFNRAGTVSLRGIPGQVTLAVGSFIFPTRA